MHPRPRRCILQPPGLRATLGPPEKTSPKRETRIETQRRKDAGAKEIGQPHGCKIAPDKIGGVSQPRAGGRAQVAGWRGAKGAPPSRERPPPRCARPRGVGNPAYLACRLLHFALDRLHGAKKFCCLPEVLPSGFSRTSGRFFSERSIRKSFPCVSLLKLRIFFRTQKHLNAHRISSRSGCSLCLRGDDGG